MPYRINSLNLCVKGAARGGVNRGRAMECRYTARRSAEGDDSPEKEKSFPLAWCRHERSIPQRMPANDIELPRASSVNRSPFSVLCSLFSVLCSLFSAIRCPFSVFRSPLTAYRFPRRLAGSGQRRAESGHRMAENGERRTENGERISGGGLPQRLPQSTTISLKSCRWYRSGDDDTDTRGR